MTDPGRHLEAPAPGPELARRSVRSAVLQLATQGAQVVMLAASGMTMARLLTPRDFGLVAMVTAISTFFLSFRDFGFNLAAVQRETLHHEQASALFWMHLRLTIAAALIVAGLGPVLAWFYGERQLILLALALGGGVLLMGIGTLQEGVLMRQMRLPLVMLSDLGAMFASLVVGITSALLGAGAWALVLQFIALGTVRSGVLWMVADWRPSRPGTISDESRAGYRELLGYGGHYTAARVLEYVARHLDRVLIGYFSGAAVLGLYENAARWSHYPVLYVQTPLTRVAVSSLSRVQQDGARFVDASRRGLLPMFALMIPMLTFMAVFARDVLLVLLGEQWLGAVPLFRILSVAGIAVSISRTGMWIYLSRGETRRQLRWALVQAPVLIVAVAIGTRWGATGVALAFALANWLLLYPGLVYCLKTSPLTPRDFGRIVARPMAASAIAAGVAAGLLGGTLLPVAESALVRVIVALAMFGTAYLASWVALPGGREAIGGVWSTALALRARPSVAAAGMEPAAVPAVEPRSPV